MPSLARGVSLTLVFLAAVNPAGSIKWPFEQPGLVPKRQANGASIQESSSFWDPFKNAALNASATVTPLAEEVGRRAPGYLAYAAVATGLGLFLPPKAITAANLAYVAAAVARSHEEGVETFCKDEGRLLLESPSIHLTVVSRALRALRFKAWRRLFARATLFRLRYQLRFMRIHRPHWVTKGVSPLRVIVQDTANAARSAQGLLPDLCQQAAFFASGCRMPYWSDCRPPLRVENGWIACRHLDRRLKREFGTRARRVRPGDDSPLGPGLFGWRIPHRAVIGATRLGRRALKIPMRGAPTAEGRSSRRSRRLRGGGAKAVTEEGVEQLEIVKVDAEQGNGVAAVVEEEVSEETAAVVYQEGEESALSLTSQKVPGMVPAEGPLIRFHNITAVPSQGSTLTKSYRALAELPYGDGQSTPDDVSPKENKIPAWAAPDSVEELEIANADGSITTPPSPPLTRKPSALQPVVIKRNLRRQLDLAADDIVAARRVLRRMSFNAEIDLDLSGVLAEVAAAVARTGDLRSEAESIENVRSNLARAGMLGSAVGVPEVVSCPELGPLARQGILVTTALRGVDVSDAYVMEHAAAHGGKERDRFVDGVFAAFGQMCLADGCFPSNPMPENLLYMYSGQVGLTDLSSVCRLSETQRRALCRLYRTLAELKGEDAENPSEAAELKARAAMEGIGLVIDLPPAGGVSWAPSPSVSDSTAEESAATVMAAAAERIIDVSFGGGGDEPPRGDEADGEVEDGEIGEAKVVQGEEEEEEKVAPAVEEEVEEKQAPMPPPPRRMPLTHVMLLRGLFDTQREEALALVGDGGAQLLRGMAVRRLPQAVAPVLKMVANLRGVCAHLDVDKSLLPRFSRAASKGLSWRLSLTTSRGGGSEQEVGGGTPPRLASAVDETKPAIALVQ